MAPVITSMSNASIAQGRFPASHKSAVLRLLFMKPHLDVTDLHFYRPISNLNFVSKILERVIDSRFTQHVNSFNLLSPFQSAYREFHSTETALVKVHNDLISAIDHGNLGVLFMLDFSCTFDTVDRQTFLSILSSDLVLLTLLLTGLRSSDGTYCPFTVWRIQYSCSSVWSSSSSFPFNNYG